MANTYTFSDAKTAVYQQLRANPSTREGNKVYPAEVVAKAINDAHQRVLNKKNYPFLNKTINFNTSVDTALEEDITSASTEFEVSDSSGLLSAGNVIINENIIAYTGNASDELTGVTNINASYESGDIVKQAYRLSDDLGITDFKKPISLFINGDEIYFYDYRGKQDEAGYTVHEDNLIIPKQSTSQVAILKYVRSITTLTADDDTFLIPDDYVTLVVEYALFKLHKQVDDDKSALAFQEYTRIVREFEADYSKQVDNKMKRIKSVYEKNYYMNKN